MAHARRIVLALCFAFAGAVLAAAPALGHAALLRTEPADRSVLETAPEAFVLHFNEPVQLVVLRVIDGTGTLVAESPAGGPDTPSLRLAMPALPPGAYLVTYRVISADAHPIAGTIVFAIGAAPNQWESVAGELNGPKWQAIAALNRALHFIALAIVAGATAILALNRTQADVLRLHLRPSVGAATLLGVVTAALAILVQGGVVLDSSLSAITDGRTWVAGLQTTQSRQSIAAAALLLATWQAGWHPRAGAVWAPTLLAVAALATLAATGHVVTALSPWLTVPMLLAHAIPALLWVGSFVPLILALERHDGTTTLRAFSRVAPLPLLVLAVSGAAIAYIQVRSIAGLTESAYGQALILKNALVVALLGLAAINRWRLTPLLQTAPDAARAALRRMIAVELALGVGILAITAVLAQTPPPRSLNAAATVAIESHDHDAAEPGYAVGAVAQGKTAIIAVVPARAGRNTITVALRGGGWTDITPRSVTASLSNATAGIEAIVRTLPATGPGIYEITGPEFAVPGEWTVKIDVLISDFDRVTYIAPVPIL